MRGGLRVSEYWTSLQVVWLTPAVFGDLKVGGAVEFTSIHSENIFSLWLALCSTVSNSDLLSVTRTHQSPAGSEWGLCGRGENVHKRRQRAFDSLPSAPWLHFRRRTWSSPWCFGWDCNVSISGTPKSRRFDLFGRLFSYFDRFKLLLMRQWANALHVLGHTINCPPITRRLSPPFLCFCFLKQLPKHLCRSRSWCGEDVFIGEIMVNSLKYPIPCKTQYCTLTKLIG